MSAQPTPQAASPTEGVIGEAWSLYKTHAAHFLTISLIVFVVAAVVQALAVAIFGFFGTLVALAVSIAGASLLAGALTLAVQDVRDGRVDLTVGDTFSKVTPLLGTIIVVSLLLGLGVGIGFLLLIVPGLILITFWAVAIPSVVIERRGVFEAFSRSQQLVSGFAWPVFGVIVLAFLVLLAASIVLSLIFAFVPESARAFISNVVSNTLTAPFLALVQTLLYFRLAAVKGGAPPAAQPPPAT